MLLAPPRKLARKPAFAKKVIYSAAQAQQTTWLAGVAKAARRLLETPDFDPAVNGALEAIALAVGMDRIYILKNVQAPIGEVVAECPYEWTASGVVKVRDIPGRFPMSYADFGDWLPRWQQGESIEPI